MSVLNGPRQTGSVISVLNGSRQTGSVISVLNGSRQTLVARRSARPEPPSRVASDPIGGTDIAALSTDFFGNRFSGHGVPHIANTKRSHCRRLLWASACIILIFSVVVLITHLLRDYFKYPKQVTIEIEEREEIEFPAVTVCNFNLVKLANVKESKFASLLELEVESDTGDCEDYMKKAPWVVAENYTPFTASDYWAVNPLDEQRAAKLQLSTTTTTTTTTTTLPPTTVPAIRCPTKDGKECVLPFFYFGRKYSACIQMDSARSWCATEIDSENKYIGVWGYCSEDCPVMSVEQGQRNPLQTSRLERELEAIRKLNTLPIKEYKGYIPKYDKRRESVRWCHKQIPDDCLETFGMEEIDPYDFVSLLNASQREDLSDIRAAFTPDPRDINKFGQKPQEFITSCTFDKTACSFRDFYVWQSDTYGNCFTFNSPNLYVQKGSQFVPDQYVRNTSKSGYQNGLRLTLNLDVLNYVSLLTPDLGVRIVVHPPRQTPIPEEEGFSVAPGFLTSIGIRVKKIYRIGPPHGHCQARKWLNYPREYSQTSCRMLCLEAKIQEDCFCSNSINDLLLALQTNLPRCNPTNLTQDLCRQLIMKKATENKLCDCPPACEDIIYTPLISTNQVNRRFYNIIKNFKGTFVGSDICSGLQNSTARLHIYLESLQEESVREVPAKTLTSLVADIGGHLGLFIGLSLASILELFEFFFDVCLAGGASKCVCCRRPQQRLLENDHLLENDLHLAGSSAEEAPISPRHIIPPLRKGPLEERKLNESVETETVSLNTPNEVVDTAISGSLDRLNDESVNALKVYMMTTSNTMPFPKSFI